MGRDIRPRIFNVNTQSDVIKFMLERVDALVTRGEYHFVDIGEGDGFVTSRVTGFASVNGYEITKGEDFFDQPVVSPGIWYAFNPFGAKGTARLNAHLKDATGYLIYYDAQWEKLLRRKLFTEVYSRKIIGSWFKVYAINA